MNEEEYRLFKDLSHLVNQQEYSEEINELKKYYINTPEIIDLSGCTKQELSSLFGINKFKNYCINSSEIQDGVGFTKEENSTESKKNDEDYKTIIAMLQILLSKNK